MDSENEQAQDGSADLMETAAASVGDRLRAAREAKGLELSHIAAETRIPERHLDSIERSDFDALPSRTYAIGFARTYARIVGLDEKEITNAVREELAGGEGRHSRVSGGMEPGDPAKLPSTGLAWFGGIAALILAIGVISFFSTYYGAGADLPSLIAEGEGAVQEIAANEAATSDAEATAQAAPTSEGQVVFTATGEGAWVRFYEEGGERLFEGVMEDGDTYEVPRDAEDPRLNTGRPNLFDITIDGQQVPPLTEEMVPVASAPVSAAALLSRGQGEDVATNES